MGFPALDHEPGAAAQEYFLTLAELEDHVRRRHGWQPGPEYFDEEPEWQRKLLVDHWHGDRHTAIQEPT